MALHANDQHVFNLLKDKVFSIPLNQRKYIWTQVNWEELLDDLETILIEPNKSHFIGSIVLKSIDPTNGIREHFSVIDGQQRILTLSCLLLSIGIYYIFNKEQGKSEAIARHLIAKDNASNPFSIVSSLANESFSKLALKYINSKEQFSTIDEFCSAGLTEKGIKECITYFYERISSKTIDYIDKLLDAIDDIRYVEIKAESDEDAYSIFEVLNARGQPLSNFDLLRNYLLKYIDEKNRKEASQKIQGIEESLGKDCEIFVRHYAIHKYQFTASKKDTSPYKRIVDNEKNKSKSALLQDLINKSSLYCKMLYFDGCTPLEQKIFQFFKARRQQQFRPLILGMMSLYYLKKLITKDKYEECLEKLFRFFVCYNVVGEQTSNKINDIVEGYSNKIENSYSETLLSDLYKSLSERIPDERVFVANIANIRYSSHYKAYSGSKKEDNAKAVLEIIEIIQGLNLNFYEMDFNLEHCYPDSESEDNSMIGNLVLIEKSINDRMKNKPLDQKVAYYQNSVFNMPKSVATEFSENGLLDILKRNQIIASKLFNYIKTLR